MIRKENKRYYERRINLSDKFAVGKANVRLVNEVDPKRWVTSAVNSAGNYSADLLEKA